MLGGAKAPLAFIAATAAVFYCLGSVPSTGTGAGGAPGNSTTGSMVFEVPLVVAPAGAAAGASPPVRATSTETSAAAPADNSTTAEGTGTSASSDSDAGTPGAAQDVQDEATAADRARVDPSVANITVQMLNAAHDPWLTVAGDGDGAAVAAEPRFRGGPADPSRRTCPFLPVRLNGKRPDDKRLMKAIAKYTGYVTQYCNSSGMLQMHVTLPMYLGIIKKISEMIGIRPNQRVLDFGCGCGTALNYLYHRLNVTGTGVDLTQAAIEHAVRHAAPRQLFCHGEGGRFLGTLPSDYFDHAISWSAVHHIRRKQLQCAVAQQLVRVVKPGGHVYIGHLRGEHTQEYWVKKKRCRVPGASMRILTDSRTFGVEGFKRTHSPSVWFVKHHNNVAAAPNATIDARDAPQPPGALVSEESSAAADSPTT